MPGKVIMSAREIRGTLTRIAHEIIERNHGCDNLVFIGMLTRGVPLARRIAMKIWEFDRVELPVGALDFGLHRDDISYVDRKPALHTTEIPFDIAGKHVVLVDDVLYTGRSVRAAMDALIDFGRPQHIQLVVFVDRGHREMPIRADYVGKNIPTSQSDEVEVRLEEVDGKDEVVIVPITASRDRVSPAKQHC